MLIIGKSQKMTIDREVDFGMYLTNGVDDVLLPNKYIPIGSKLGEEIDVFIYRDSADRPIATTLKPLGQVDDLVSLKVKSVANVGAFLDLGLEKDLMVPFKEQHRDLVEGENVLVKILLDHKTNRMIGVTKISSFLNPIHEGLRDWQEVDLLIWEKSDLGYKVIINGQFEGLLYTNEIYENIGTGDARVGYVKKLREDGKIDVSLQKQGYVAVKDMSQSVLDKIVEQGGTLALGDKSSPEEIKSVLGMSKKHFKKIIGGLYKSGEIIISEFEVSKKIEG
jgi:predicted RNA-binding protein (virulence factor B family)